MSLHTCELLNSRTSLLGRPGSKKIADLFESPTVCGEPAYEKIKIGEHYFWVCDECKVISEHLLRGNNPPSSK